MRTFVAVHSRFTVSASSVSLIRARIRHLSRTRRRPGSTRRDLDHPAPRPGLTRRPASVRLRRFFRAHGRGDGPAHRRRLARGRTPRTRPAPRPPALPAAFVAAVALPRSLVRADAGYGRRPVARAGPAGLAPVPAARLPPAGTG